MWRLMLLLWVSLKRTSQNLKNLLTLRTDLVGKVAKGHVTWSPSHQVCCPVMCLWVVLSSMLVELVVGLLQRQQEWMWVAAVGVEIWVAPLQNSVVSIQTWTRSWPWLSVSVWRRREQGRSVLRQRQKLQLQRKGRKNRKMGREWMSMREVPLLPIPSLRPRKRKHPMRRLKQARRKWATKMHYCSRRWPCLWVTVAALLPRKLRMKRNLRRAMLWRKTMRMRMLRCN
mmetsp:Transcript_5377/g.7384  ORF Transcript_5377/g.7384 Transcript_5377/m.7384 type:complete len:228 (-) Transcript_5377:458-1141(-)